MNVDVLIKRNSKLTLSSAHESIGTVYLGDSLAVLPKLVPNSVSMIYIDPPFNTGIRQTRTNKKMVRDPNGNHTGFQGQSYRSEITSTVSYDDSFDDFISFLRLRIKLAHRLLSPTGSLYLHLDYREVHYAKVMLDEEFGRENFINEIIWAYDYGARSKSKWPAKHDNILLYSKDRSKYYFNSADVDREPYMAPGLVTPQKRELGKLPTDVWWHTIVSPTGHEKTGYPTQKPLGILRRMITASTQPGDTVLDFFAGSGTTGIAAKELGRKFLLVDSNPMAIDVIKARFGPIEGIDFIDLTDQTNSSGD
ncbi:site-specific DNA-methyltransferase [Acidithrix sp. C25]|uniref:DNA-methyltransferase n=1 Tax=Acidithrix sp. C25 TaxID=1671482 RepID=UPI00191BB79C|nr:site-specific DNA-methyltransferase [Acidithrix sp. C25]CAG4923730.1 unnamed protein product [Acidithrix sp. C25]